MVLSLDFYDKLSEDDKKAWKDEYKEDVMAYFNRSLVTKIGNATLKMLRFVFPFVSLLHQVFLILQGNQMPVLRRKMALNHFRVFVIGSLSTDDFETRTVTVRRKQLFLARFNLNQSTGNPLF